MNILEFYLVTLGVIGFTSAIQALGFNLQFGVAGIINLAYVMLVAVGAYATAIASLGPPPLGQTYIGGFGWGFPWNLLFGVVCALIFGAILGVTALLRLRHDYLALTLIAMAQGAQIFTGADIGLVNGVTGMQGVQGPWVTQLSPTAYSLVFLSLAGFVFAICWFIVGRYTKSPFGRALRAVRDDEIGLAALGKSTWILRFSAFSIGAGLAGLAGGLLVLFTSGWNPQAWLPTESAILLAAILVGGRGRNSGAILGAGCIVLVIGQASTYLPPIGPPQLLPSLQNIIVGLVLLAFLWWRPQGILPERRERFPGVIPGLRRVAAPQAEGAAQR